MTTPRKKAAPRKKAPTAAERMVSATIGPQMTDPTPAGVGAVSDVSGWKSSRSDLLTLPSGHTIRAKNPGLRAFLTGGLIPNSLMGIITDALEKRQEPDLSKVMKDGQLDLEMAQQMYDMYDSVFQQVCIEPPCHPKPKSEDPEAEDGRRPDRLYVDEVDDEDKMFVFGWVSGGTRDVERFRQELDRSVDALSAGQGVVDAPVSPAGNRAQRRAR